MSVPIHRFPSFFNLLLDIHLFSPNVYPPALPFARTSLFLTSSLLLSTSPIPFSPLPSTKYPLFTPSQSHKPSLLWKCFIHPSLPRSPKGPCGPRLHNEILASLIVLIKAVRKEQSRKYSCNGGKQRLSGALPTPSFSFFSVIHPL